MSDIVEKIQDPLELAKNNPSEAESAAAMSMARKLMLRHNLTQDDLAQGRDQNLAQYGDSQLRNERDYFRIVAQAAAEATGTRSMLRGTYSIFFAGRKQNIELAEFIFHWLVQQVEVLYKIHLPKGMTKAERSRWRKDFKRACATRINDRMYDLNRQDRRTTGTDLVMIEDQLMNEIDKLLEEKGVKKSRKPLKIKLSSEGGRADYQAGNQAILQPRVSK